MDDLKKFNFTELDSSEMKQVQGGGLLDNIFDGVVKVIASAGPIITPIIQVL